MEVQVHDGDVRLIFEGRGTAEGRYPVLHSIPAGGVLNGWKSGSENGDVPE